MTTVTVILIAFSAAVLILADVSYYYGVVRMVDQEQEDDYRTWDEQFKNVN